MNEFLHIVSKPRQLPIVLQYGEPCIRKMKKKKTEKFNSKIKQCSENSCREKATFFATTIANGLSVIIALCKKHADKYSRRNIPEIRYL